MNTQNKIMSLIIILSLCMALFSPQLFGSKYLMSVISIIIGFVSLIGIVFMFMGEGKHNAISLYNFFWGLWVFRYKRYRLIKRYLGKLRIYFRKNRILLFIVVLTISVVFLNVLKYKFKVIEDEVYIDEWSYDSNKEITRIRYSHYIGDFKFYLNFKGYYYFIESRYYYIKYRNNVLLDFREIIK